MTAKCDWKLVYPTLRLAEEAAERTPEDRSDGHKAGPLLPYWCAAHRGFHIGHFTRGRAYRSWGHDLYSKVFAYKGRGRR